MRKFSDFEKKVLECIIKRYDKGEGPFFSFVELLSSELLSNDILLLDESGGIGDAYICCNVLLDVNDKNYGIIQIISLLFLIDWLEKEKYITFITSHITRKDKLIAKKFISDSYYNNNGKFVDSKSNVLFKRISHIPLETLKAVQMFDLHDNHLATFNIHVIRSDSNIIDLFLKILNYNFVINEAFPFFVKNGYKSFEELEAEKNHDEARKALRLAQKSIEKAEIGNKYARYALLVAIIVGLFQIIIGCRQGCCNNNKKSSQKRIENPNIIGSVPQRR